jgi:hypothetical protein
MRFRVDPLDDDRGRGRRGKQTMTMEELEVYLRETGFRAFNMVRFRVEPRDVPPAIAARRLGLEPAQFEAALPALLARSFPSPDPTTGNFDIEAINRWCDARHAHLFGAAAVIGPRDASTVVKDRIAALRERRHG